MIDLMDNQIIYAIGFGWFIFGTVMYYYLSWLDFKKMKRLGLKSPYDMYIEVKTKTNPAIT